jgi:hypothetical protein
MMMIIIIINYYYFTYFMRPIQITSLIHYCCCCCCCCCYYYYYYYYYHHHHHNRNCFKYNCYFCAPLITFCYKIFASCDCHTLCSHLLFSFFALTWLFITLFVRRFSFSLFLSFRSDFTFFFLNLPYCVFNWPLGCSLHVNKTGT